MEEAVRTPAREQAVARVWPGIVADVAEAVLWISQLESSLTRIVGNEFATLEARGEGLRRAEEANLRLSGILGGLGNRLRMEASYAGVTLEPER